MRRKRRLHKPEFKAKVALETIKGEMTMAGTVKNTNKMAQVTQWKKQLLANGCGAFDSGDS